MNWQEIRKQYPEQWLLIEAIKARSEKGMRILEHIAVINLFSDSVAAMKGYRQLKNEAPERELFVLHTRRKEPNICERRWLGIRGVK